MWGGFGTGGIRAVNIRDIQAQKRDIPDSCFVWDISKLGYPGYLHTCT
jgi:hypothetical protein